MRRLVGPVLLIAAAGGLLLLSRSPAVAPTSQRDRMARDLLAHYDEVTPDALVAAYRNAARILAGDSGLLAALTPRTPTRSSVPAEVMA